MINRLEQERRIDAMRAGEIIGRSAEVAIGILERLVEAGALERRGDGPRRGYHLSGAVYAALGNHAGYARASGFPHLQHEQMVLRLLLSQESVTRRDVAALCQLDSDSARRLLGTMSGRGDIILHGVKRGAHYTLSPAARRLLLADAREKPKRAKSRPNEQEQK